MKPFGSHGCYDEKCGLGCRVWGDTFQGFRYNPGPTRTGNVLIGAAWPVLLLGATGGLLHLGSGFAQSQSLGCSDCNFSKETEKSIRASNTHFVIP